MHIARVGLGISALAVAIIVVYGYLFGLQSAHALIAPSGGLSDFYYFSIIAMAAGALAAMLAVRRGLSARRFGRIHRVWAGVRRVHRSHYGWPARRLANAFRRHCQYPDGPTQTLLTSLHESACYQSAVGIYRGSCGSLSHIHLQPLRGICGLHRGNAGGRHNRFSLRTIRANGCAARHWTAS